MRSVKKKKYKKSSQQLFNSVIFFMTVQHQQTCFNQNFITQP